MLHLSLPIPASRKPVQSRQGFSLVELLLAIAIVSVLSTLAVPAFNSVATTHGVTQGLYDISSLLERGRTEAITRQTYVWVVFQNATVENFTTQSEIRMAAFASQDGTSTASAGNIQNLTKILHVRNAKLTTWSSLKATTTGLLANAIPVTPTPVPSPVYGNTSAMAFLPGANEFTITFTPRGEAMLNGAPTAFTPYNDWIDVSFQQTRGTQVIANAEDAAVIIDGSTGSVQRIRL